MHLLNRNPMTYFFFSFLHCIFLFFEPVFPIFFKRNPFHIEKKNLLLNLLLFRCEKFRVGLGFSLMSLFFFFFLWTRNGDFGRFSCHPGFDFQKCLVDVISFLFSCISSGGNCSKNRRFTQSEVDILSVVLFILDDFIFERMHSLFRLELDSFGLYSSCDDLGKRIYFDIFSFCFIHSTK